MSYITKIKKNRVISANVIQIQGFLFRFIPRGLTQLARAKQPSFILSGAYFFPSKHKTMALHRRLFFLSCRRPSHVLMNLCAYLRWVSYYTWVASYKACRAPSVEQLNDYGLQRHTLFWRLVREGLFYMIPPRYYFKHQLYKPENRKKSLAYFYNQQLPYFHDYSHRTFKHHKTSARLIGNKSQFALALQKIGVPTVNSTLCSSGLELLSYKKNVFCKPNTGSQSQDAFLMTFDAHETAYQITPINGHKMTLKHEIDSYLASVFSRHQNILVQPFIYDHDEVKKISGQLASTTVRIITEKSVEPSGHQV